MDSAKRFCAFLPLALTFSALEQHNAAAPLVRCPLGHNMPKRKCLLPIVRLGRDEAIFRVYAMPKGVWVINSVQALRKKQRVLVR